MDYEPQKKQLDELLSRLGQGDRSALGVLYQKTVKQLYSLCYSFMREKTAAEDALMDGYLRAARYASQYKSGANAFSWLCAVMKNGCLNQLKKQKREIATDFTDRERAFSESDCKNGDCEAACGASADGGFYDASGSELIYSEASCTSGDFGMADESGILALAKKTLGEKDFSIVVMHAVGEIKFGHIAATLKMNEATVRWRYHSAIGKLRSKYTEQSD